MRGLRMFGSKRGRGPGNKTADKRGSKDGIKSFQGAAGPTKSGAELMDEPRKSGEKSGPITDRMKGTTAKEAREYAEKIVDTVREPLIVLDANLKVISANKSFYRTFKVDHKKTHGRFIYDLGNRQWNIPELRLLLEKILPKKNTFENFEIEHDFETIGKKTMLLNARRLEAMQMILLAIEDVTERKKAEEATKEAREYAESIVNAVREPLLVLDEHMRVFSANKSFYRFFKSDKNEIVGKLIYNLGNGQWNIPKLRRLLQNILPKNNQVMGFEVTHNFENIGIKTMLLNGREISLGSDKVKAILLAIEDITGRRVAEGLLSAAEAKYHKLFESTKQGVLILDAKTGMIIDVNPFLIQLLGFSYKQFLAKKIWDIGLFKDIAANKAQFRKLQEKKHVRYEDLTLETKGGVKIHVEFISNVFYNVDQKVIQCNIRDITERKKAEEMLRSSEEKFRAIFDNANDIMLLADMKTKKFYVGNNTACQMLGYSLEEIKKLGVPDIHPKEDLPHVFEQFQKQVRREIAVAKDLPVKRKDGTVFYADVNTSSVTLAGRKYLLGIFRDVTERKKAEEDMNAANRELTKTRDELEKSLRKLKEMDVKKDQFISVAAHELKTPLTSIHGFSQLLMNREVADNTEKRENYLRIMDHETKRLAKLVNEILDLSRMDIGTMKYTIENVDVYKTAENTLKEIAVMAKDKGLRLKNDIEKGLPRIRTDGERLTEILLNLLNNAVKYTEKGGILLRIFMDGREMHFMVKDTGIGIAKENHGRMFERFYQVDSSYTRSAGGSGLGLSICEEFVTALGGRIWFSSKLGKGSEFHFTLPIQGPPAYQAGGAENLNLKSDSK